MSDRLGAGEGQPGCCIRDCPDPSAGEFLPAVIWPPSDLPSHHKVLHAACFERLKHPGVTPDGPHARARVPSGARCCFCGDRLPIIGRHPLALEVGPAGTAQRYWIHADCEAKVFRPPLGWR